MNRALFFEIFFVNRFARSRVAPNMYIFAIAAAAVFGSQAQVTGWDDYRQAELLLNDGLLDVYTDPIGGATPAFWVMDPVKSQITEISGRLRKNDYLAERYALIDHYAAALNSISIGNTKPVSVLTSEPMVHDLSPLSYNAAKLLVAQSYCKGSEGDSAGSVQPLLSSLTLTGRLNGYTLLGNLFGSLADKETYARFSEILPSLSLKDIQTVQAFVNGELSQPAPLANMIQAYQAHFERNLGALGSYDKDANDYVSGYSKSIAAQLSTASQADLKAFVQELRSATQAQTAQMMTVAQGPEDQWWQSTMSWPSHPQAQDVAPGSTMQQLADALLPNMTLGLHQVALVELTRRAELRLLSLNAAIVAYRWHNHHLPSSLGQCVPDSATYDPLSGQAFAYELNPTGYRLYSKGRPDTGIVELNYAGLPSSTRPAKP